MKNLLADALYHALWAERAMIGLKAVLVEMNGDEMNIKNATAGLEHLYDCQKALKKYLVLKSQDELESIRNGDGRDDSEEA